MLGPDIKAKRYLFHELNVGMSDAFDQCITQDMLESFCHLSGDYNPLHLDHAYATAFGFKTNVVYGLLTTSLYSRLCGMQLPGELCLLHSLNVSFKNPVYVGDNLTTSGEITSISHAVKVIMIRAKICNSHGVIVSTAKIQTGVRE